MAVSVLIVEDDRNIAELLQMYLEKEGYAVTVAADGGQGLAKFRAIKPDLVLLDVMMPVMDGWAVCRAIRAESQTPVIMLTAKGETDDKVAGLKNGADDYITKPFEMKEVLARIEAVLRRSNGSAAEKKARRLVFDKLVIDMDAFELTVDGKKVDTPPKDGAAVLPGLLPQPGLYPQPAAGRGMGIRLLWRFPDGGCPRQAPERKAGGCLRPVEFENGLGRWLQVYQNTGVNHHASAKPGSFDRARHVVPYRWPVGWLL